MPKAIIIKKNGGPEVLELQDVKIGAPGPDEIKVTNHAIGLNYIDTYHRSGLYPLKLPSGIGLEAAGKVEEVGSNVKTIRQALDNQIDENLRDWFGKGKDGGAGGGGWDRYNTKGERIGKCGDRKKGEGKPKCLSKSKAAKLRAKGGKKAIGAAVSKKRRQDPNKNRRGKAKNVSNTKGK